MIIMVAKVIGVRKLDFEAADGKKIEGLTVFVTHKSDNDFDTGEVAEKIFISKSSKVGTPKLVVGKEYDFCYDVHSFNGKATLSCIKNKDGSLVEQNVPSFNPLNSLA